MNRYIVMMAAVASLAACNNTHKASPSMANTATAAKASTPELQHIPLKGGKVLPESAAIDPENGDLYVGSTADGSIQKISGGNQTWFLAADTGKNPKAVSGMAVDTGKKRLWVLNVDLANPKSGATSVRVFDLSNGKELKSVSLPKDGLPHGLNDIALDRDGNAFISDCFSPNLWRVDAGLSSIELFIKDAAFTFENSGFNLNGLAFTPDGKYLIGSVVKGAGGGGSLFRIDVASKKAQQVNIKHYDGGDGIAFGADGALYTTTMANGLSKVTFSNDYTEAVAMHLTGTEMDRIKATAPSSVRSYGQRLYVVGSQLDHTFPNSPTYQKPFAPFEITAIPLAMVK